MLAQKTSLVVNILLWAALWSIQDTTPPYCKEASASRSLLWVGGIMTTFGIITFLVVLHETPKNQPFGRLQRLIKVRFFAFVAHGFFLIAGIFYFGRAPLVACYSSWSDKEPAFLAFLFFVLALFSSMAEVYSLYHVNDPLPSLPDLPRGDLFKVTDEGMLKAVRIEAGLVLDKLRYFVIVDSIPFAAADDDIHRLCASILNEDEFYSINRTKFSCSSRKNAEKLKDGLNGLLFMGSVLTASVLPTTVT